MKQNRTRFIICIIIISALASCTANAAVDYLKKYQSSLSTEAIEAAKTMIPLEKMSDSKLEIYRFGYAAGYDAALGNAPSSSSVTVAQAYSTRTTQSTQPTTKTYILNKSTKKFHLPTCSSVKKMSEKNKLTFTGTRNEVINKGYQPCKQCNP